MIQELAKENVNISYDEIQRMVNSCLNDSFWEDFNTSEYDPSHRETGVFWENYGLYFFKMHHLQKQMSNQVEYIYEQEYNRSHALVSNNTIAPLNESEIETLALEVLNLMESKKHVVLSPPEPNLALKHAQKAIDEYNTKIEEAKGVDDAILTIVTLVQELERLHLFHDVNLRTNYFLLNKLLTENGIKPTMLSNPNHMDCYSRAEFCEEVKQGVLRYDWVIANQEELSKKTKENSKYQAISQLLEAIINNYKTQYDTLISKINILLKENQQIVQNPRYFQPEKSVKMSIAPFQDFMNQLNETNNALQFLINIKTLDLSLLPTEIKNEIGHLEQLLQLDNSLKWFKTPGEVTVEKDNNPPILL